MSSEALQLLQQLMISPPKQDDELPQRPQFFGGLDLAKRVDSTYLEVLRLEKGILYDHAGKQWPHVKYGQIAKDVQLIQSKITMEQVGIDRTGVGDGAIELFDVSAIPLVPIVMTNARMLDIIHIMRILLNIGRLKVERGSDLEKEITQQQEEITNSGKATVKHPVGKHDDRFWALGYACYVALPYMINMPPAVIKVGFEKDAFDEGDITKMIANLMGGDDVEIQRFQ